MSVIGEIEKSVKERYGSASHKQEIALCCPVEYNQEYLKVIPKEIIERDYGCGDPSQYLKEGETVLDLGSGTGKICYIASQVVGKNGKVIGVDMTDDMLALANKYKDSIAKSIGYQNVEFKKATIQDLKLDLREMENLLLENPIQSLNDYENFQTIIQNQKETKPLIPDESIDVIVSNCVLNLVKTEDKNQMFQEMYRVLKKGGRCVISDIVSDEQSPQHLIENKELWTGCISGAFQEYAFLKAFEDVGFHGIEILKYDENPWQIIEGIEYRSLTVIAYKGKEGPCLERNQAVIYKGPWKMVLDDDGHCLYRGERMAVCDKTFHLYQSETYSNDIIAIPPSVEIDYADARPFNCHKKARRSPDETKGDHSRITKLSNRSACDPLTGCC